MFTFERMRQAITAEDTTSSPFSSTEIELMKQVEKNVKKVGHRHHERIVLYFTPALSLEMSTLVKDFKTNDTDLMNRLIWVVGHVSRVYGSDPVDKGKLPLGAQNVLSSGSWLKRLEDIQLAMPDLVPSLCRSTLRASKYTQHLPPEKIDGLAECYHYNQDFWERMKKKF